MRHNLHVSIWVGIRREGLSKLLQVIEMSFVNIIFTLLWSYVSRWLLKTNIPFGDWWNKYNKKKGGLKIQFRRNKLRVRSSAFGFDKAKALIDVITVLAVVPAEYKYFILISR